MQDLETLQYLFDLQDYLVLSDVLSRNEVTALNELFEQQKLPPPESLRFGRFGSAPEGAGFLEYGRPFCDLLDHAAIMPILRFRLGESFRLDRLYGMYMNDGMERGPLHADYGATAPTSGASPGQYYQPRREIADGFVVVSWSLTDAGPQHGGFSCIPGSHKSNFGIPRSIFDAPERAPCVITPDAPAGSVVMFTESLTHGTAAWTGKTQRRTLLYKYCVANLIWKSGRMQEPRNVELTPRQRLMFGAPGHPVRHFPSLFEEPDQMGRPDKGTP
jgi:hypothetical protein